MWPLWLVKMSRQHIQNKTTAAVCISRRALPGEETFYEIFTIFHFLLKSKMATKIGENWIFPPGTEYCCTTLWVKNSLEIALSLTVFQIFTLFHFPRKSKMATKSSENWNFSPLHRTLFYYPAGQKFARNRSISYGFREIHTFHFPLKSKMAAKIGENWNFFLPA